MSEGIRIYGRLEKEGGGGELESPKSVHMVSMPDSGQLALREAETGVWLTPYTASLQPRMKRLMNAANVRHMLILGWFHCGI